MGRKVSSDLLIVTAVVMLLVCSPDGWAVVVDWVTVGDPGNVGELSGEGAGGFGPDRICGRVDYIYRIGKCEVTNAQYTDFLNAVDQAGTNPYDLYSSDMSSSVDGGIHFDAGAANGSKYSVKPGWGNKPVNYVSFWDACRFANWLHNGQGNGDTETGAYSLNGVTNPPNPSVTRNPGATIWIPTEDEWYKAAYYKGGGTNAGYWDYATQSDMPPNNNWPADDTGNSANYDHFGEFPYTTEVGAYTLSGSSYGTFDQNGNLWELTETILGPSPEDMYRVLRGGAFVSLYSSLHANHRNNLSPPAEGYNIGFRVGSVPEPSTILLLALAALPLLRKRRT